MTKTQTLSKRKVVRGLTSKVAGVGVKVFEAAQRSTAVCVTCDAATDRVEAVLIIVGGAQGVLSDYW